MPWNDEAQIRCRFAFICPQLWKRLEPTEKEDVRHCAECNRDVHLAMTEAEARRHSDEGRCIAVPLARDDDKSDPDEPVWIVGSMERPYGAEVDEEGTAG